MGLLRNWTRKRALRNTRIDPALWDGVLRTLPFLRGLSPAQLERLRDLAILFLAEKEMHGAAGMELTDAVCLSIALQACLPILELGLDVYDDWVGVVIYPGEFVVQKQEVDEFGVMHETRDGLSGEAWPGGPVVLSWEDVQMSETGYNVVIHEFAHKLHMRYGDDDETPPARPGMDQKAWRAVFQAAWNRFCDEVDADRPTLVDPYGAEHPAEFFAVMSEMFFTASELLARDWPELYAQLALFYRQDPAERMPAGYAG